MEKNICKRLSRVGVAGIISLTFIISLAGCSNNNNNYSSTVSDVEQTEPPTEAPTDPTTEPPTEPKKSNQDIKNEIESMLDHCDVTVDDEQIDIYEYTEGMRNLLSRCSTNGDFSVDAYEMWLDMKETHKGITLSIKNEYDRDVTWYILDDEVHSSCEISAGQEFSYIASFSNGYCIFDISD